MAQVIEVLPWGRQGPLYPVQSIPRVMITWWRKKPGHHQPWFWLSYPRISCLQHQRGLLCYVKLQNLMCISNGDVILSLIFKCRLVSNIRRTSNIPDFGEFPAWIFSDHQFGQNLQYKTHPEFWLLSVDRLLTKCEVDPHGPSCSEWPEILTHRGSKDQWHLISLGRMRDMLQ